MHVRMNCMLQSIEKKRGVTSYNIYEYNDGVNIRIVKTEVLKNKIECLYHIMKKCYLNN